MILFWLISGGLAALAAGLVTAPLVPQHRLMAAAFIAAIPAVALGLYFVFGRPELLK